MKINNELFVTVFGLVVSYLLFASGQAFIMSMVVIAVVCYSVYCGYHFKGGKSYFHAILPIVSFIIYFESSAIGGVFSTAMMLIWALIVLAVAYYCDATPVPTSLSVKSPETKPAGKYCPVCGTGLVTDMAFCSSCGKEQ